ncbi:hypothetical protein [Streptomyces sp. NPDC048603]|uniref:hypothetical protein n=1 Tax=Streptomyces sp. NPDC048603 TaxID=3365577 RepID=UPI00371406FC
MFKISCSRRVVLAAASVALIGGGVALPATAVAAVAASAVPSPGVALAPQDGEEDILDFGGVVAGFGLLDGDDSVPGVMGGDLMDPGYPEGGEWEGTLDGGDDESIGARLAPGATGSEGRVDGFFGGGSIVGGGGAGGGNGGEGMIGGFGNLGGHTVPVDPGGQVDTGGGAMGGVHH